MCQNQPVFVPWIGRKRSNMFITETTSKHSSPSAQLCTCEDPLTSISKTMAKGNKWIMDPSFFTALLAEIWSEFPQRNDNQHVRWLGFRIFHRNRQVGCISCFCLWKVRKFRHVVSNDPFFVSKRRLDLHGSKNHPVNKFLSNVFRFFIGFFPKSTRNAPISEGNA